MNPESQSLIEQAATGSNDGSLHFSEVVQLLNEAGVESYSVDYRAGRTSYYLGEGAPYELPLDSAQLPSGDKFNRASLQAAIWGAQRGVLEYPEFSQRACAAGCVGYSVWLNGGSVTYFGRNGEVHREDF